MNRLQFRYGVVLLLLPLLASSGTTGAPVSSRQDTPAAATESMAAADATADAEARAAAPATAAPLRPDSPLAREVLEAERTFNAELDLLTQAFQGSASDGEALAAQRRIEALKAGFEITLLEIQARHARAAGRTGLADELDRLIAQARAGSLELVPAPAPAPAADPNAAPAR